MLRDCRLAERHQPAQVDHARLPSVLRLDGARGTQAHRHAVAEAEDDQVGRFRVIDALLAQRHRLVRQGILGQPAAVAGFVQVLGHVQRDRLEEGAHAPVHLRQRHQRAQHHRRIVAAARAADHEAGNVAQRGDRVVVVEMPAETALIAERGDPHHHRVAVLAIAEELQAGRLAADLVARVVEIRQVLDFRQRQHAHVGVALRQAKDDGLVQQGVEHATRAEGLLQALGDGVDATLLRHVLAEQQRLGILREQVVQRGVDLDRQMLRAQLLGQLRLAAECGNAHALARRARGFGLDRRRRVRRQRRHHFLQRRQPRATVGVLGGGETLPARGLVQVEYLVLAHDAGFQRDRRRTQQRVGRFHRAQFLDTAPLDLEIGAGMAHDPRGAQVQEGRAPRAAAVFDRLLHVTVAAGQVEAVCEEIVEVRAVTEVARHPAVRRLHRDADAVVLAHEQHRRRQLLVRGPRGGVEGGLRGGMVAGGIAEGADGDAVVGNGQFVPDAPRLFDGDRGAEGLGQVRSDGRGLRQHPQGLAAPHLVAATGGRVFHRRGERQRRIHHRVHPRQLAEALGHETAAAVVQECRIGMAREPRDHRVALVAAAADRVEDLVLHAQHARHQVEVARDQLRFEHLAEPARIERAARQHRRGVVRSARDGRPVPAADELAEIDVTDLGAVEALHAGRDRIGNGGKHAFLPLSRLRKRAGVRVIQVEAAISAACSGAGSGMATNPAVARTRASQSRSAGYGDRSKPPSAATSV